MMKFFFSLILLLVQLPVFSFSQTPLRQGQEKAVEKPAQENGKTADPVTKEETAKSVAPRISGPLPFKVGEVLSYDVSFERLIFSGTIGDLKLSVNKSEAGKPNLIALKADLVSKGFFSSLFGIKVKDQFNAIVSTEDFGLFGASKFRQEGKVNTEEKTYISREAGRVTYIFRDLANKSAQPKVVEGECANWVQDIISAIYFVRAQDLKEGDIIAIPITEAGKNYTIEVIVGKREAVKVDAGKFNAIKVETKAFSGRLIRKSGELFLWFSDDARRLLVKARVKVSGTTVNIELKKIQQ